jgi:hypothetical protein
MTNGEVIFVFVSSDKRGCAHLIGEFVAVRFRLRRENAVKFGGHGGLIRGN